MRRPRHLMSMLSVTAIGAVALVSASQFHPAHSTHLRGELVANQTTPSSSGSSCPTGNNVCIGPQAMEGNLQVSPGDTLKAGFDFKIPGQHPATNDYFSGAQVTFTATCVGVTGSGAITVATPETSSGYTDPPNDASDWFPSKDQTSPLVYQGSVSVPSLCGTKKMSLSAGGTFTSNLESFDTTDTVQVRFHYSADGSAGGWSSTQGAVPVYPSGTFYVSGSLNNLVDGVTNAAIPMTITNPNPFSIQVLGVQATIAAVPAGCVPPAGKTSWLSVANFSSPPSSPITLGPSSRTSTALSLPAQFIDSKTDNQSNCIGKSYTMGYTGNGVVSGP